MHFGAAVRELLSVTCDVDLRHAKPHTVVDALESPPTRCLLGANIEATFGVRVPAGDLARLTTVRDVLQCVRLHRWLTRVERERAAAQLMADVDASAAAAPTPTTIAARAVDPDQQTIRFTRRRAVGAAGALDHRPAARRAPTRP
jgi:hypothetical protein